MRSRRAIGLAGALAAGLLLCVVTVALAGLLTASGGQARHDALRQRMERLALDLFEVLKAQGEPRLSTLLPRGRPVEGIHRLLGGHPALGHHGALDRHAGGPLTLISRATLEEPAPGLVAVTLEVAWRAESPAATGRIVLARLIRTRGARRASVREHVHRSAGGGSAFRTREARRASDSEHQHQSAGGGSAVRRTW
jgi:hypothetical protein